MLIRNVKSYADLEKKRNLQAQILQVQIDNESMLESRVKDYQNPNKPPPVPPQYKTNSELALDTNFQQKEVIDNLLTIKGVDNILALGVSQGLAQLPNGVGNYLIFNKNFPVIRKRLEDISKRSYSVQTFMEKIEEVLQQIELGILYQSTGGADANVGFNMGMGGALILPSGQDLPSLQAELQKPKAQRVLSSYGKLLAELYEIRDAPQSLLAADVNFINMLGIVERLCEASPETDFLQDFDLIEQLERQKLQRDIGRLNSFYNLPKFIDIEFLTNNLVPAQYAAAVAQQPIQLPQDFERAYSKLLNRINGIKTPLATSIGELQKVKDKITALLGGQVAVRQQLQGQLNQAQQAAAQANRLVVVNATKQVMDAVLANPAQVRERILQQAANPYTNVDYYQPPFLDYGATISGNPPIAPLPNAAGSYKMIDITNAQQINDEVVIEMREIKIDFIKTRGQDAGQVGERYEMKELPYTFVNQAGQQIEYPIITASGRVLTQQEVAGLGRFLYKNILTGKAKTPQNQILQINAVPRYNEQELANIVRNQEINPLKQRLDSDPNYDPLNNQGQQALRQPQFNQGFGLKKGSEHSGKGLSFREFMFGSQGQGFKDVMKERSDATNRAIAEPFVNTGNKIKSFFGGGRMCPQNYEPVMAKDGKMYGNRCKAQAGGGEDPNYKIDGMGFMNRKIKIGKGIAVEEQPRYKTFGKYIIHMPYLENDNVLNVKFQSMGSIPSIKPVCIDDNFKDFVLDIMNTGCVNQKHYNSLTDPEKAHFHKIVKGAGLSNTLKFKQDDKIDDKKDVKRLDILVGQVVAGNDNDKVLKEAKELIRKCVGNGSITRHRGMDLLFQIE
jgi:hypothetical protein